MNMSGRSLDQLYTSTEEGMDDDFVKASYEIIGRNTNDAIEDLKKKVSKLEHEKQMIMDESTR